MNETGTLKLAEGALDALPPLPEGEWEIRFYVVPANDDLTVLWDGDGKPSGWHHEPKRRPCDIYSVVARPVLKAKPCSCCGCEPVMHGRLDVRQVQCGCGAAGPVRPTEREATEVWNEMHEVKE